MAAKKKVAPKAKKPGPAFGSPEWRKKHNLPMGKKKAPAKKAKAKSKK